MKAACSTLPVVFLTGTVADFRFGTGTDAVIDAVTLETGDGRQWTIDVNTDDAEEQLTEAAIGARVIAKITPHPDSYQTGALLAVEHVISHGRNIAGTTPAPAAETAFVPHRLAA